MVHIRDEGSYFDGSIQTVWRYLNSDDEHPKAHRSVRNRQAKPVGDTTFLLSMERNWRGEWVKVVNRLTVLPPLGTLIESLEGPFAGSKSFTVFTPEGQRTRVDVYGEFRSPVLPEAEVEAAARAWLEESYNEDAPAIKSLQSTS
ncbi:MAG: hypothetical protein WB947_03560 [Thermoplasmata archaeon]